MRALLIVDMQNDFMPEGPLAVPGSREIIPLINRLMERFPAVVATQDWHPPDHVSFAENHPGSKAGDVVECGGMEQIVWPRHCVQHSVGAQLVSGLDRAKIDKVIHKGTDKRIDSYSAFFDNAHRKKTGLAAYLAARDVDALTLVGVAADYCVCFSALDALELGFHVTVIEDGCRGIKEGDVKRAFQTIREKGGLITSSKDLT